MISLEEISRIGIGTSNVASLGRRVSPSVFGTMLEVAAAAGSNVIDTSDFYGSGDAEHLIRKAACGISTPFFIITKAGLPMVALPGWLSPLGQVLKKLKQKAGGRRDYSAGHLIPSLQRSNRRLGRDAVDAFLLHEPSWDDVRNTDSWEGLAAARNQGLARFTGVSTNDLKVVEEGIRSGQVQLVQTFAAWGDAANDPIPKLCKQHNIPVIINRVMDPFAGISARFASAEKAIHGLEGLDGITCPQFLIAGAIVEKEASTALTGTLKIDHLKQNLRAAGYVEPLTRHLQTVRTLLA